MSGERLFRRKDERGRPTGPYYAWWYDAEGTYQQRSTRQYDHKAAADVARQWERESADPRGARLAKATLRDALDLLIQARGEAALAGTRSAATVRMYEGVSKRWLDDLGEGFPLAQLDAATVDAHLSKRRAQWARKPAKAAGEGAPARGVSEHTLHKELVVLRAALRLAKRAGIFAGDLGEIMPVGFGQHYTPRARALAPADLPRLLAHLAPDDAARVCFVVATSARWAETVAARREDVDPALRWASLRGTKTAASARVVPIVPDAAPLLRYALDHAEGAGGLLFTPRPHGWTADLARACKRAGVERVTANDLRRTFATWLRASGAAPELIAPAMGHADSTMVERVYGRLSPDALAARLGAALGSAPSAFAGATGGCRRGAGDAREEVRREAPNALPAPGKPRRKRRRKGEPDAEKAKRDDS